MSDQSAIQRRYLDPYEKLTSDTTNKILKAVYPEGVALKEGLQLSITGALSIGVTQGIAVKDFVVIEYFQDFTIDFPTASPPDGYYYVVFSYRYQKQIPPPAADVKVIEPGDYNPAFHILLGVAQVTGGSIVSITDEDPGSPGTRRPPDSLSDHNALPGIQGGISGEYFHLTQAEYNIVHALFNDGQLDHNELTNIQGGFPGGGTTPAERYHFTDYEHTCILNVINGTAKIPFADTLNGCDSICFAMAGHNHEHASLCCLEGDGPEFYHLNCDQYVDVCALLNGTLAIGNADTVDGKHACELACVGHNHAHNTLCNLQGGDGTSQFYHLTEVEHGNITDMLDGTWLATNALCLGGLPACCYSQVGHNHVHDNLECLQGGCSGQYFHVTSTEHAWLTAVRGGTCSVPNADLLDGMNSSCFSACSHTHNHDSLPGICGDGTYHVTQNWFNAMNAASAPSSSNWFMTCADLSSVNHNALGSLQGGCAGLGQFYHLTNAEHTALTGGGDALGYHHHDSCYYKITVADATFLKVNGSNTMNGHLTMGGGTPQYRVTNMADPINPQDGATKGYVDSWTPSSICHNDLSDIQGGNATERYHITLTSWHLLTSEDGIICDATSAHNHNSCYYRCSQACGLFLWLDGSKPMTGCLNMNNNCITGLPTDVSCYTGAPTSVAVSKAYVDSLSGVPSGAIIGKTNSTPPTGYTYLGLQDSAGFYLHQKI